MTAQEQQMLQGLTDRIGSTQLNEKDPEAEQYLQETLGRNPDALYIMAQTLLVQGYAMEQAQKQLADLKSQLQAAQRQAAQPKHATSFLGNLLGVHDDDRPAPPPPPAPPQYAQPQYAPVPGYASGPGYPQPGYAQPGYAQPGFGGGQSGGFLRSAMQTATGVAAGALAFEGIESLMHGFGGHSGGGYGFGGDSGRPEEIINNNYYGDAKPGGGAGLSSDIEDRRGDTSRFSDAVDSNDHGYTAADDTSNTDDSANNFAGSGDDSSSYDDSSSGGDDSGSGGGDDSSF